MKIFFKDNNNVDLTIQLFSTCLKNKKGVGKNALKTKTPTDSIMQFSSITSHIIQDQLNPHHSIFEGSAQI